MSTFFSHKLELDKEAFLIKQLVAKIGTSLIFLFGYATQQNKRKNRKMIFSLIFSFSIIYSSIYK
jgi:hypothetical protein